MYPMKSVESVDGFYEWLVEIEELWGGVVLSNRQYVLGDMEHSLEHIEATSFEELLKKMVDAVLKIVKDNAPICDKILVWRRKPEIKSGFKGSLRWSVISQDSFDGIREGIERRMFKGLKPVPIEYVKTLKGEQIWRYLGS